RSLFVKDVVAIIVIDGASSTTEIIFQNEACLTIGHFTLNQQIDKSSTFKVEKFSCGFYYMPTFRGNY
ncbi:MAG: hypothetical protein NC453_04805, partial [Muribaculum sp.]|nr:hypothetical protein [Muribaculum sp.]